jgi:hypothetical protein
VTVRALLPLYAAALFTSAVLAFWIQPLFAKLVLPRYGGAPAVWTTAALFFQVMLLAGYAYAHVVSRIALGKQLALHALVVGAAVLWLPVGVTAIDPYATAPVLSLLAVLATSLGVPFFALAATAPLLQQWFSRTGHRHAGDPYFLYSASNAGSLIALIAYPLVLETLLGLREQTLAWSVACALFAALLVACGVGVWRHHGPVARDAVTDRGGGLRPPYGEAPALRTTGRWASPTLQARLRWFLLAFAPSSLMLGVTQHITSEIAAVPLLWLAPLTIYVLTFVVAFARRQRVPVRAIDRLQPLAVIALVLVWPLNDVKSVLALHLAIFAVTAMMCHAELARLRPAVRHLTSFYLWLAIGGAAGGAFNAIVAPLVFNSVLEYPLALALACALRSPSADVRPSWRDLLPAAALGAAFAALIATDTRPFAQSAWLVIVYLQAIGVTLYVTQHRPLAFALVVFAVIVTTSAVHSRDEVLERHRSFFGVHTVLRDQSGKFNVLMHGITIHGAEYIDPQKRATPVAYFHANSGIAQVLSVLGRDGSLNKVAVIGMGAGTLACYGAPGREWTFFEIDPVVVQLARDDRYFHYLADCAPNARIVLGDGRLTIGREPPGSYDLIVVDTFSSDSVPAHMITREALALYLSRLTGRGLVVFQVTNQYLDLFPVLARLAADAHVSAFMPGPQLEIGSEDRFAIMPSRWVAISRDASRFAPLVAEENWMPVPAPRAGRVWTDDFSNVLSALK